MIKIVSTENRKQVLIQKDYHFITFSLNLNTENFSIDYNVTISTFTYEKHTS